jgi:hypothetical protein
MFPLVVEAQRYISRVVTERVCRAARGKADVLTIGIDLADDDSEEQAELVAILDVAKRRVVRWTGKSYPTARQERTLVHVVDLDSHLLKVADERVLVLGCHDLNMFSPRARANQARYGARWLRCREMRQNVVRFEPTVVLHHPHTTDTPNTWRMPWLSLARELPTIRVWASGIAYFSSGGKRRAPLARVLDLTKSAVQDVFDIVVDSRASR